MAYIPKRKRKRYERKKEVTFGSDQFYNKSVWRKTSKSMIAEFVICPVCEERPSQMTDHVISRPDGADYDTDNLLPMCHTCHNRKRGLEAHANDYLIETRQSSIEDDKLVPVDKLDIVEVLRNKPNVFKSFV